MTHTLEGLAQSFHRILKEMPGRAGRIKVCEQLRQALQDPAFVGSVFSDSTPERHLLHEDPELGFCIFAHQYLGAKAGSPHDHGPSWAIYGQALGETQMTDWDVLEPASAEKAGKVKKAKTYKLRPGDAFIYNEGDVHSPSRDTSTRLIRIEGTNLERVKRFKFDIA